MFDVVRQVGFQDGKRRTVAVLHVLFIDVVPVGDRNEIEVSGIPVKAGAAAPGVQVGEADEIMAYRAPAVVRLRPTEEIAAGTIYRIGHPEVSGDLVWFSDITESGVRVEAGWQN